MLSWKSIVQDYIIKHSNLIRKATCPLREYFGISYFTYHKISASGNYTVLVDRPDWAEHYVNESFFLQDPYLRHPSVYQSGICLFDSFGSEEYQQTVTKAGKELLDIDVGVMLIQKKEDEVEFFGFCGNKKSSSLQNLYLNQPQMLRSFASYFKKELEDVLKAMREEANSLVELKGEDFFCKEHIFPDALLEKREEYYKSLGFAKQIEKASKLSLREKQCLKLLIEGKSAKETAKILGLSSRTVEFYFENIKNKTSSSHKQELFGFAKELEILDLLLP